MLRNRAKFSRARKWVFGVFQDDRQRKGWPKRPGRQVGRPPGASAVNLRALRFGQITPDRQAGPADRSAGIVCDPAQNRHRYTTA